MNENKNDFGTESLKILFKLIKNQGTPERIILKDDGTKVIRRFALKDFDIFEAAQTTISYRVAIVTWHAELHTKNTERDDIISESKDDGTEWKAIFKTKNNIWHLEDLLFKEESTTKMSDIKKVKDKNHESHDWYDLIISLLPQVPVF